MSGSPSHALPLFARWEIVGILNKKRELTSQKNANWRGYVWAVACLGSTFEVTIQGGDAKGQYDAFAEGAFIRCEGEFEIRNNIPQLILKHADYSTFSQASIGPAASAPAAAPSVPAGNGQKAAATPRI